MRRYCYKCYRPDVVCYCHLVDRLTLNTKVVVLAHPAESRSTTSSGRMIARVLTNAEFHVGPKFGKDLAEELLNDRSLLLYPAADAAILTKAAPTSPASMQPRCLVVLEATWHQSKDLVRQNPWLREITPVRLSTERVSDFQFRRQPARHCLSSVEATHEALTCLEGESKGLQKLLRPFYHMVRVQLAYGPSGKEPAKNPPPAI